MKAVFWTKISTAFVFAATLAVTPAAKADSYGFSFNGGGLSAQGVLVVSPAAVPGVPGAAQVTGISGSFTDTNLGIFNAAITGLVVTGLPSPINADGTFLPPGPPGPPYGFSWDNLFYAGGNSPVVCPPPGPGDPEPPYPYGGGLLDIYGVLFNVAGGYTVDMWSNGVIPGVAPLTYGASDSIGGVKKTEFGAPFSGTTVGFAASPVPEPGSLVLLGTGLLGFAGSMVRRFKR